MSQALLFPDPRPLDQRLGAAFFKDAPRRPGVYLMKDAANKVLYVGKARDLKQRLNNYRVANPDRMPRRHLRMVREVARIEFQFCPNESAALRRESKLLRSLKPRFNRAGVWPGKPRFIVWRKNGEGLEMGVTEVPGSDWRRFGPLNGSARPLHHALVRLLWLATNPKSIAEIPAGWIHGRLPDTVTLNFGAQAGELLAGLENYFWQTPKNFFELLDAKCSERTHSFERMAIAADMETLENFSQKRDARQKETDQIALL
ncbi:MAG TPA: nucleotide excision repair endonuclease [Verrucomicrobiae bacterium]|nr:nucleotide excision repair endonuclease [Verrucomicrobiae bacterium]